MEIEWKNIDIAVLNNNKRYSQKRIKLVSNACGYAGPGLLAIMGPSGSGKTTLIQALAGRLPKGSSTTGIVTVNGAERNIKTWKDIVGFVDQDDTIYEELTACETVTYAAKFRLKDRGINIKKKVETLFEKLAIAHILRCKMKNLSGGERKRVMIAVELVTDPKIIFLDEPTSGLDNNTTLKIVRLLKDLGKEGKTIVFTIHQPDNITASEFDEILLLSQGCTVYMGKMSSCENHLISHGFEKRAEESFSNFAMKILDVEPGVYHETVESSKLNSLVVEVKDKYNCSESDKNKKTSNDWYVNLTPNLYHIALLLRRRIKLEPLIKKNTIIRIIYTFFAVLCFYIVKNVYDSLLASTIKNLSNEIGRVAVLLLLLLFNENPVASLERFSTFLNFVCAMAGFITSGISYTSGMTFNSDHFKVKREIAVNTYSITSYYASVYIFELMKAMPFFIFYMCALRIIGKNMIDYLFFLTFTVLFLANITAYLFVGSILRGTKKVCLIVTDFALINSFPINLLLASSFLRMVQNKKYAIVYILNILPNYVLSLCPVIYYYENLPNKLLSFLGITKEEKEIFFDIMSLIPGANTKELKEHLFGREVEIYGNFLFAIFLIIMYVVLCNALLAWHLKPNYRMKLNKR